MNQTLQTILLLFCSIAAFELGPVLAQAAAAPDFRSNSNRVAAPPLPQGIGPVAFFRELLAKNPSDRQKILAGWPADRKAIIETKLKEYETLTAEQRELRLRVTELRHYLLPLLLVPAGARDSALAQVPDHYKPLLLERLHKWDTLSPEKQKQFLEDEAWFQRAAEFSSRPAQAQQQTMSGMNPDQRRMLEAVLHKWQQQNPERRLEMASQLESFFGLRPQERARTLRALSDNERAQIQRTLQSFSQLDAQRRARCVAALDKLVKLSPEERDEFLRDVERWQSLSPDERKSWRHLVLNLSLPPTPKLPPPPAPSRPRSSLPGSPSVATN